MTEFIIGIMKRFRSGIALCMLAVVLCVSVTACGNGQNAANGADQTADAAAEGAVTEDSGAALPVSADQEIPEAGLAAEEQAMAEAPVDFDPEGHYLSDDMGSASMDMESVASVEPPVPEPVDAAAGVPADSAAGAVVQEAAPAVDPNLYFINIGINRLVSMSGTAEYGPGGVMRFTASADVDPDAVIIGDIYGRPDHVTVVIADSQWKYLDAGTVLNFYKQVDPVEEVPEQ